MADLGGEIGARELDMYNQSLTEVSKALIELIKQIATGKGESFDDKNVDKGIKMILKHAKDGGEIKGSIIEKNENDAFEKSLKDQRVPFAKIRIGDKEGGRSFIYLTRGELSIPGKEKINDSQKVYKAYEKIRGLGEKDKQGKDEKGFTVLEIEKPHIERAFMEREIPYTIEQTENMLYKINVPKNYELIAERMIKQIRERLQQIQQAKAAEKEKQKKEKEKTTKKREQVAR